MFAPPRSTHCRITPAHILPRHSAASPSRCAASASSSRRRATATSARSARASRRCTRRAERARQQGSWRRGSASTVRPMPGVSLRLCQMLASAGFCYSFLDTWGSVSLSIPPSSLSLSLCPSLSLSVSLLSARSFSSHLSPRGAGAHQLARSLQAARSAIRAVFTTTPTHKNRAKHHNRSGEKPPPARSMRAPF